MVSEIDVVALKGMLDRGEAPVLLDVREAFEVRIASLPGAKHIPLGQLHHRKGEIEAQGKVVVFCHHGVRSMTGAYILQQAGAQDVVSLTGGIDAWSTRIDPSVPRY